MCSAVAVVVAVVVVVVVAPSKVQEGRKVETGAKEAQRNFGTQQPMEYKRNENKNKSILKEIIIMWRVSTLI